LAESRSAGAQALTLHNRELADLDDAVRVDSRYVAPVHGLFADAAAFARLFSDPREGTGFWLMAIVGGVVLFVLECASLLALALMPASPLDVLRVARNRVMAAAIVADAELMVAQQRARMGSPVRVTPLAPRHAGEPRAPAQPAVD
jgi:hypothetical protein